MTTQLHEIAQVGGSGDPVTKPLGYYRIYEQVLKQEGLEPATILEIGVHQGESTTVLARRFPAARILALDLRRAEIDFSLYPNITYLQCDQTDGARLSALCAEHFPAGIDLVIDDASHIGQFSAITFHHVFPFLRSGGLYMIEDWGTGYWASWVDGSRYRTPTLNRKGERIRKFRPSHDSGMVGFVKSLVDLTAVADITEPRALSKGPVARLLVLLSRSPGLRGVLERLPWLKTWCLGIVDGSSVAVDARSQEPAGALPQLASLHFFRGVCVARKA